jgi:hypothetical protein
VNAFDLDLEAAGFVSGVVHDIEVVERAVDAARGRTRWQRSHQHDDASELAPAIEDAHGPAPFTA